MAEKKILMVVPPVEFDDEAYDQTRRVLTSAGNRVTVASLENVPALGVQGLSAPTDAALKDVKYYEYDAVVFVGGPGARILFDDERARKLAKDAEYKVLGAVGNASYLLARAGVLKNKRVTGDAQLGARIAAEGAIFTGREVEIDGKIVTTRDASYGQHFANALIETLNK